MYLSQSIGNARAFYSDASALAKTHEARLALATGPLSICGTFSTSFGVAGWRLLKGVPGCRLFNYAVMRASLRLSVLARSLHCGNYGFVIFLHEPVLHDASA